MKNIYYILLVSLLLFEFLFSVGCTRKEWSNNLNDVKDEMTSPPIEIAITKFDEVNGHGRHKEYEIEIRETEEEWCVDFDRKSKLPGDHALVTINKKTNKIEYFQGE